MSATLSHKTRQRGFDQTLIVLVLLACWQGGCECVASYMNGK